MKGVVFNGPDRGGEDKTSNASVLEGVLLDCQNTLRDGQVPEPAATEKCLGGNCSDSARDDEVVQFYT